MRYHSNEYCADGKRVRTEQKKWEKEKYYKNYHKNKNKKQI